MQYGLVFQRRHGLPHCRAKQNQSQKTESKFSMQEPMSKTSDFTGFVFRLDRHWQNTYASYKDT